jgi:RluA family pseudouridine synthase
VRTRNKSGYRALPHGLAIIHEDADIVVVNKPAGLLTVATDREAGRTAYFILTDYVRKGQAKSRNRVFIVHRLDRETSGVLIFAKSERAKFRLQEDWENTRKKYLAVVHGAPRRRADTISTLLEEVSVHTVRTTRDPRRGRLAKTAYTVLKKTKAMALLEVELLTGRKHQIRVHLAEAGTPIVGDRKYGLDGDRHSRLALHALSVCFTHPTTGNRLTLEAKPPPIFESLVGGAQ